MPELDGLKAFVVEDEAAVAFLLEAMLDDMGVEVAASAARLTPALAMAAKVDVDFALLDINLAGETSFPVAEVLAARRTPFVFVTGYGAGMAPGSLRDRPVVAKPFLRSQIEQAIDLALGR